MYIARKNMTLQRAGRIHNCYFLKKHVYTRNKATPEKIIYLACFVHRNRYQRERFTTSIRSKSKLWEPSAIEIHNGRNDYVRTRFNRRK